MFTTLPAQSSERWKWLSSTSTESFYFDTKSAKFLDENNNWLDVWVRCDLTPTGAKEIVKQLNSQGYYDRKIKKIGFLLTHYNFSFSPLEKRILSWAAYDNQGNALICDGAPLERKYLIPRCQPIVPGTDEDLWLEIINSYLNPPCLFPQ